MTNESWIKPFNHLVFILSIALIGASADAGNLEELHGLQSKLPGRVYLYHADSVLTASDFDLEFVGEEASIPPPHRFMRDRVQYPGPQPFGRGPGGPLVQEVGSERIKLLGRALDKGGMAQAVAAHGNHCYVGTTGSLSVFDVTDPNTPVLVHETGETVSNLEQTGTTLGAIAGCKGDFVLFDLLDPAAPAEISRLSPPVDFFYEDLALGDSMAITIGKGYIDPFGWCAIMQVIDISDPFAPEVNSTVLGVYGFYHDVLLEQDSVYLSVRTDGIAVFDISDPTFITQLSLINDVYPYIDGMDYDGGYLYLAGNGLEVVDVSDPSHPELVGQAAGPYTADVRVSGGMAYEANDDDLTVWVFDVSDPMNPTIVGKLMAYGKVFDLFVLGDQIYLPDSVYGLLVVDVSTPTVPQLLSMTSTGACPLGIDVEGDLAAANSNFALLHTLDVSDPFAPEVLGDSIPAPEVGANNTFYNIGLDLSGGSVVTSDWTYDGSPGMIHTYDVTTPTLPERIGDLNLGSTYSFSPVKQVDNWVYVGGNQLLVIDISDPANPVQAGTGSSFQGNISDIKISGTTCYVSSNAGEVAIVDISNPTSPLELNRITVSERIPGVAVENDILGVFWESFGGSYYQYTAGLELYDVSNPLAPTPLGNMEKPQAFLPGIIGGGALSVEDGRFFLCTPEQLFVIDAQDPFNPYLSAVYPESPCYIDTEWSGYGGVCAADGLVYLAGHNGVEVLRFLDVGIFLTPESDPLAVPRGGSFTYEMKVENFTSKPQIILVWADDIFPDGTSGPLAEPVWVSLNPGENVIHMKRQQIPANAPLGTYHLYAHVSVYPGVEMDNDRITFEVVP